MLLVLDGNGKEGYKVAELVKEYLSSEYFLSQLVQIGNKDVNFVVNGIEAKSFFQTLFLRIDESLNQKMAHDGGTMIAFLFVDAQKMAVSGVIGSCSVFGVKHGSFDVVLLNKHHVASEVSRIIVNVRKMKKKKTAN